MTVKEFIEKHPDASLDIMSSSGYIFLTPSMAKNLLSREPVKADPGAAECFRLVKLEEYQEQPNTSMTMGGM